MRDYDGRIESLAQGGLTQVVVEPQELETPTGLVSPVEGCGKLKSIRGSQGVRPKKPLGTLPHVFGRLNLGAYAAQSGQHLEGLDLRLA